MTDDRRAILKKCPPCPSGMRHHYRNAPPYGTHHPEWEVRCCRTFPDPSTKHPLRVLGCRVVRVFQKGPETAYGWRHVGYRILPPRRDANDYRV